MYKTQSFYWFEFDAEHLPLEVQCAYTLSEAEYRLPLCDDCLEHMLAGHWDCASALFTAVIHLWHTACCGGDRQEQSLFLDQALDYMKRHIRDLTVRELADQMQMCIRDRLWPTAAITSALQKRINTAASGWG